jgi:hypothetical protein
VSGDLRVRYHGDLARVEIAADALEHWLAPGARDVLRNSVRSAGFARVALDARGFRSGSLNVLGGVVAEPLVRARSGTGAGDAEGLTRELRGRGLACDVEGRERLAVLTWAEPGPRDPLAEARTRADVIEAARGYGFTHVAVDLAPDGTGRVVDGPAAPDATVRRG